MRNNLTFKRFTDFDELAAHKEEWNNLLVHTDADQLFMSFEWILAWWKHFGSKLKLDTYFIYIDGELVGVLPLVIRKKEGFRQLTILGVGKSDYVDFLIREDHSRECLTFFYNEILQHERGWDICVLSKLVEDRVTFQHLSAFLLEKGKRRIRISSYGSAPFLMITSAWEDYLNKISKKMVGDTRRQIRRIEREFGNLKYESMVPYEKLDDLYSNFVEYHRVRRDAVKKDYSMFNDDRNITFYRDIMKGFHQRGTVHFSVLYCNDLAISMHLGFIVGNKFYYLVPVFNSNFQKYSIGRILLIHLLEEAFTNHYEEFDFCYGDEPYKYEFSSSERSLREIIYCRRTIRGILAALWFCGLRKWLRKSTFIMDTVYPRLRFLKVVREVS